MKRIALVAGLVLVAAALAGVLRPEGASAVDPAPNADTVTVSGAGVVTAVPDRAQISAGVESRAATARAALQANAAAMEKVLDALRARGGQNVTTQTVSLSTSFDEQGRPNGFVASNVASAETSLTGAGALIDAAVAAGANQVYGPSLSRSDADALYRDALAKAVDDARERAAILAKAAGRELGRVTAMVESGASDVANVREGRGGARLGNPDRVGHPGDDRDGERHLRAAERSRERRGSARAGDSPQALSPTPPATGSPGADAAAGMGAGACFAAVTAAWPWCSVPYPPGTGM